MTKRKADCTPEEWTTRMAKHSEYLKAYRQKNLEKIRAQEAANRAKRPKEHQAKVRAWEKANDEAYRRLQAKKMKRQVDMITPAYVATLLRVPTPQVTPELLELKREQLRIVRLTRQLKEKTK